ncbi:LexA family protein [Bacillus cereus]|uniref:LexA family protein n=1 Tax=Bacillus cereus TaxID=1396 RepID=UPI00211E84E1|nr:XRE family transcriptional regulator [Bacillus cereus]
MSNSIADNIRRLRKNKKMTQGELAERLGVKTSAVSAWELGRSKPLMDKVELMSNFFQVTKSQLIGDNFPEQPSNSSRRFPLVDEELYYVPILEEISCGAGVLTHDNVLGYEPFLADDLKGGDYFCVRAKGDSMMGARIMDGDLLLIRKQIVIDNGQIGAICIGEKAYLKRIYKEGYIYILQSENPDYPPIVVDSREELVRVVGKLKEVKIRY